MNSNARFRVVVCGRRFGKTVAGQRAIINRAYRQHQACWWLSPTYPMAFQVWRDLKAACRDLDGILISETERRIDFPGGGWLAIRSAHHPDNLRGAGLDFVVLDEAAFMSPTVWPEVVRPMLLERRGCALFLSSPNSLNWFWELYLLASNQTVPSPSPSPRVERGPGGEVLAQAAGGWGLKGSQRRNWRAFHFTPYDNPLIAPDELDSIRAITPERIWREEYMAEFLADTGQVFRDLRAAATAPLAATPIAGIRYICGLDWGRQHDQTALVVFDADRRQVAALDYFTGVNWSLQRARLKHLYERWQPAVIWAEANSIGGPNIEALVAEGLPVRPFVMTARSKPPLIEDLALAIERRDLALLPDETLLNQLAAYRMERLPNGGYRYSAPSGLHDDLVIALALAWHGCRYGRLTIDFA